MAGWEDMPGVHASVRQMPHDMHEDPGSVTAAESAQLIRLVATGHADDLAGEACSIDDQDIRTRTGR